MSFSVLGSLPSRDLVLYALMLVLYVGFSFWHVSKEAKLWPLRRCNGSLTGSILDSVGLPQSVHGLPTFSGDGMKATWHVHTDTGSCPCIVRWLKLALGNSHIMRLTAKLRIRIRLAAFHIP